MHSNLTYLIVDDDELDRLAIEAQAAGYHWLKKIASCSQPLEAFELTKQCRPDILFADIEMPDTSGLELVEKLAGQVPAPIFITSHPEYALDSYSLQAFDYILKPLSQDRFNACAKRLSDFFELRSKAAAYDIERGQNEILIKQGHERLRISLHDILYLEAMKDYTRIITADGQFLVLQTLTGMIGQLPADRFIRIHRSFVVNRQRIDAVAGNNIRILAHELPVSRQYKPSLRDTF